MDAYAGPQGFDHVPILRALKTPTLWLVGEDDESIPVRHTLRNLRAAIGAGAAITLGPIRARTMRSPRPAGRCRT